MVANSAQKLKLLHLMDIMQRETDPVHGLTMPQIIEKLGERGVSAERKSIYADLDALREFGMDIRKYSRRPPEYGLAERDFELSHLTLLMDAVQSSRFLTEGSTRALVKSIRGMASTHEAAALDKQVHVHGRPRDQRKSDFVAVDKIQVALSARRKLAFRYFKYDAEKRKVARKGGRSYVVSPVNLTYSDGNYYLVAFSEGDGEIRNYRVDRMDRIEVLREPALRNEAIGTYDADEVGRCAFGMYHGEDVMASLRVDADMMNVVIDRFGREVDSTAIDDGVAAKLRVRVKASPVFFGWLVQMGTGVEILGPESLREGYVAYLREILDVHEG